MDLNKKINKVREMLLYYHKGFGNEIVHLSTHLEAHLLLDKGDRYKGIFENSKKRVKETYELIDSEEMKNNKDFKGLLKIKAKHLPKLWNLSDKFFQNPKQKEIDKFREITREIWEIGTEYHSKMMEQIRMINLNGNPDFHIAIMDYKNDLFEYGRFQT